MINPFPEARSDELKKSGRLIRWFKSDLSIISNLYFKLLLKKCKVIFSTKKSLIFCEYCSTNFDVLCDLMSKCCFFV